MLIKLETLGSLEKKIRVSDREASHGSPFVNTLLEWVQLGC